MCVDAIRLAAGGSGARGFSGAAGKQRARAQRGQAGQKRAACNFGELCGGAVALPGDHGYDAARAGFNLALAWRRAPVNPRNGTWGAGVQLGHDPALWARWHQPFDDGQQWFAEAEPAFATWSIDEFDKSGHKLAEYGVTQYGLSLSGGYALLPWAQARAGYVRLGGSVDQRSGGVDVPDRASDVGELYFQLQADALDAYAFPTRGFAGRARLTTGLEGLGSAAAYDQFEAEGTLVQSRARVTLLAGGMIAATLDGDVPIESQYHLGGLGRLSGLQEDERTGPHAALLRGMAYRQVGKLFPVYTGVSVEYGSTFESRNDIGFATAVLSGALFAGIETPLGPLCLAGGLAESGRGNFYLTLGQRFGSRRPAYRPR